MAVQPSPHLVQQVQYVYGTEDKLNQARAFNIHYFSLKTQERVKIDYLYYEYEPGL